MQGGKYLHAYALSTAACTFAYRMLRRMFPDLDESHSAKRVSLIHACVSMLLSGWWVLFAFDDYTIAGNGWKQTFSSTERALRICTVSGGYMLYDMHAAVRFHKPFIFHHIIAVAGFLTTHFAGRGACLCVHNIFCAEIGGVFFHLNRPTPETSPIKWTTRTLFLFFVGE